MNSATQPSPDLDRPSRKAWWARRRKWWVALGIVAAVLVIARASLDPLATHYTRRGLDAMEAFDGTFSDVSFSVFALSYTIEDLEIRERLAKEGDPAIFATRAAHARVLWRNLLRGDVIGSARLDGVRSTIVVVPGEEPKERKAGEALEEPPKPWALDDAVQRLIPFKVERLEVTDGELVIIDARTDRRPELRFAAVEAAVENFTTRKAADQQQPMTVALQCGVQSSGRLKVFLTADLLAENATFSCQAKLLGLQLVDIRESILAAGDESLLIPTGELDCFVSLECREGRLTGGIKPLLKNADLKVVDDDFVTELRAALLDTALELVSDRVPGRKATAAVLPVDGHVTAPTVAIWPTIFSALRNAFVEGLSASFRGLPAGEADSEPPAEQG